MVWCILKDSLGFPLQLPPGQQKGTTTVAGPSGEIAVDIEDAPVTGGVGEAAPAAGAGVGEGAGVEVEVEAVDEDAPQGPAAPWLARDPPPTRCQCMRGGRQCKRLAVPRADPMLCPVCSINGDEDAICDCDCAPCNFGMAVPVLVSSPVLASVVKTFLREFSNKRNKLTTSNSRRN